MSDNATQASPVPGFAVNLDVSWFAFPSMEGELALRYIAIGVCVAVGLLGLGLFVIASQTEVCAQSDVDMQSLCNLYHEVEFETIECAIGSGRYEWVRKKPEHIVPLQFAWQHMLDSTGGSSACPAKHYQQYYAAALGKETVHAEATQWDDTDSEDDLQCDLASAQQDQQLASANEKLKRQVGELKSTNRLLTNTNQQLRWENAPLAADNEDLRGVVDALMQLAMDVTLNLGIETIDVLRDRALTKAAIVYGWRTSTPDELARALPAARKQGKAVAALREQVAALRQQVVAAVDGRKRWELESFERLFETIYDLRQGIADHANRAVDPQQAVAAPHVVQDNDHDNDDHGNVGAAVRQPHLVPARNDDDEDQIIPQQEHNGNDRRDHRAAQNVRRPFQVNAASTAGATSTGNAASTAGAASTGNAASTAGAASTGNAASARSDEEIENDLIAQLSAMEERSRRRDQQQQHQQQQQQQQQLPGQVDENK